MRSTASPRMNVVRKEDKERQLIEFISKDISVLKSLPSGTRPVRYRLIALSHESPVAKALAALAGELAEAGIVIEAVFARADTAAAIDGLETLEGFSTFRHAADNRLFDAHEQLVLGPATVWVGDCMRRDPAKRDAYEFYGEDCAEAATWALRSFNRMWSVAQPVVCLAPASLEANGLVEELAGSALAGLAEAGQPVIVATRH